MKYKDYYEILGVNKSATDDEIRKAYRKLAKKYHPDSNPGNKAAEEKFKEITEANDVLSNTEKRKNYDNFGSSANFQHGSDFDPSQYGFNQGQYSYDTGGGYSDFFKMFFGDGGGFTNHYSSMGNRSLKGQNIESTIQVALKEAYYGHEKEVMITTQGTNQRIRIKIPKGIQEGEKIRLKGKGGTSPYGGEAGDLLLIVKIMDEPNLTLKGLDLYSALEIYPWEAALGVKKNITILDQTLQLTVPAGINTDKKIRLLQKGFKTRKGEEGNLYVTIKIVNPLQIDDKLMETYQKLATHYQK